MHSHAGAWERDNEPKSGVFYTRQGGQPSQLNLETFTGRGSRLDYDKQREDSR